MKANVCFTVCLIAVLLAATVAGGMHDNELSARACVAKSATPEWCVQEKR